MLGIVPHQLRGFLAQFRNLHIVGAAYDRCTGCSETVRRLWTTRRPDMMTDFWVVGPQGVRDTRIRDVVESIQRNGVPRELDRAG